MAAGLTLAIKRALPGPPSLVFEALTDPEEIRRWWGPHGFSIPSADFHARVGGSYRIEMQPPEGQAFFVTGEFRVVDATRRLAFTFRWEEPEGGWTDSFDKLEARLAARA